MPREYVKFNRKLYKNPDGYIWDDFLKGIRVEWVNKIRWVNCFKLHNKRYFMWISNHSVCGHYNFYVLYPHNSELGEDIKVYLVGTDKFDNMVFDWTHGKKGLFYKIKIFCVSDIWKITLDT